MIVNKIYFNLSHIIIINTKSIPYNKISPCHDFITTKKLSRCYLAYINKYNAYPNSIFCKLTKISTTKIQFNSK